MKENNKLFKSKVCFDDYYEDKNLNLLYDCWIDANCNGWNGWACPYLEESEYNNFMDNMKIDYSNPNIDDGSDGNFINELLAIKPEIINGKTMYYFGGWLTWNIEDGNFQDKRNKLLEEK